MRSKIKKALVVLLAALMVLGVVPTASAAGTPTVSISSGEVQPGGEVTLTVSIKDNPGLAATLLYIYYDTSVFEVDHNEGVQAVGKFESQGSLLTNSIAAAKQSGRYEGDIGKDGLLALWFNTSGRDTAEDGSVMTITLAAKNTAGNGDYSVSVGVSANDTCNQYEEDVVLNTVPGTITVSGGTTTKPAIPTTPGSTVKPGGSVESVVFTDIEGNWAEEYILRANAAGLVEGYGAGKYGPNEQMTRAQFVTILWRAMGSPAPAKQAEFTDLDKKNGTWYLDAVAWAEENSIVNGIGGGKFGPNGTVTREQIATILHRLAGKPMGMELMLGGVYDTMFPDSGKVSDWAKAGLYWTLSEGIYCGESSVSLSEGSSLAPGKAANRAQIAVMMIRYLDYQGGRN